ncbi:MAG: hypothetical protein M3Q56_03755, partial [Bacteroidota bacterium]|nr:hypothetical protein [Bacteroidota bacterium]
MKKILSIAIVLCWAAVSFAQTAPAATSVTSTKGPKMVLDNTTVDYGEIKKGADPVRKAIFVN